MKRTTKKIVGNQTGQGVMEYIIISSLIGIFCLSAIGTYGNSLKKSIGGMERNIRRKINTVIPK